MSVGVITVGIFTLIFWRSLSDFERETKMSVGVITVGILYADFLEDNENSIKGGRMSVTSGFWGVFFTLSY